jgi:endonuclease/exonuclease/phosphatase family metal-dependent hydrolase
MSGRLLQSVRSLSKMSGRITRPLAILFLTAGASGCASRHPAPLLVQPRAQAVADDSAASELNLKLVTYNIWGLPSWMSRARPGRYPRIARELERLDPDIVLLQEAWTAKARKAAPDDGHWSIARAARQHTFFQQSGLMTLSKFPIIGGEFYPFSRAAFPDRFVNKGILKVTVQLQDGRVLNIWNVHLQDGGSAEIRRSQLREIESHVLAAEDGQIADLVGGDFNCTPDSAFVRELADSLGPSVQQLGGANPFVTWDDLSTKPGNGQTLDYIFIRERTKFQNVQAATRVAFTAANLKQRLSDHLGIEAEVKLSLEPSLAGVIGPLVENPRLSAIATGQDIYVGGE